MSNLSDVYNILRGHELTVKESVDKLNEVAAKLKDGINTEEVRSDLRLAIIDLGELL